MPKLRDSFATQGSANELAEAVSRWLNNSDPAVLFQTCLTCNHNDPVTSLCKRFNRVPPTDVIVGRTVCPMYQDHEIIPF